MVKTSRIIIPILVSFTVQLEALKTWEPHDLAFAGSREFSWWEFPVKVDFSYEGEPAIELSVEGFWAGGNGWIVRTTFPKAGQWTWKSGSPDPVMHGLSGTIEVSVAIPDEFATNPNLRGSLRISENNRHFEYADGTPFFMLASTLWAGNTYRCGLGENQDGPFFQHLADRKSKGFNTILMQYFHGYGDYPESPGHRNEGGKTYLDIETKELNPDHFRFLDTRMRSLWDQGFVVANPTTWWGKTKNCVFTPKDAQRMSRYCAVRYGAFNTIWSLSGEYQYAFQDCGWTPNDFTALGEEVQRHNPFKRPLSIHPSGRTDWPSPHNVLSSLPFHGESWLDHHWLQTGQGRDRLFNIVTRLAENRALEPSMPIFCSEAFYERPEDSDGAYHTRWQVWTAFLNGAAGFGYGAFGLWQFYDPNDPEGETGKYSGHEAPWREAQEFEGSSEVIHARTVLTRFDWWQLQPARDRILLNGELNRLPDSEDLSPPQAAKIDEKTWVVYLPRGNEIQKVSLQVGNNSSWTLQWIDPRTGFEHPERTLNSNRGLLLLQPRPSPTTEDWVALIRLSPRAKL